MGKTMTPKTPKTPKPPKTSKMPKTPKTSKQMKTMPVKKTPNTPSVSTKSILKRVDAKATVKRPTEETQEEEQQDAQLDVQQDAQSDEKGNFTEIETSNLSKSLRQPSSLPDKYVIYRHTHLRQLSRRAQLRRAGKQTLELLHARTTQKVFDALIDACRTITIHQNKKTFTRATIKQACAAIGLNVIC